jgi:hypothetical protein
LHYCQVGKRWDEAFDDRDEHATGEEIAPQRYLSGEFTVNWGEHQDEFHQKKLLEIHQWLRERGENPEDKKLSLGFIYLGQFNRLRNFGELSLEDIHELLAQHSDVAEIKIILPEETVSAHFPYSDLDENYQGLKLAAIKKTDEQKTLMRYFSLP